MRVQRKGKVQLADHRSLVITDVGQPVYATDDDTFVFNPVGGTFIGIVKRLVSSGVVVVGFDLDCTAIRMAPGRSAKRYRTKTFDAEMRQGVLRHVAADDAALTLPAIADGLDDCLSSLSAVRTTKLEIDPAAADSIRAADLTAG